MAKVNQPIQVFSTHATDILMSPRSELGRRPGGPLLFIEQALQDVDVPFVATAATPIAVEILMADALEQSRITQKITPRPVQIPSQSDWVIISTICDEWVLSTGPLPPKLFIDIQGFVRAGGRNFGKKKIWNLDTITAQGIFCLKGTHQEMGYLPRDVYEDQKSRLLVMTNGKQGVDVCYKGKQRSFVADTVDSPVDTIGAGDTFFAYFVAAMYQGSSPFTAAEYAVRLTAQFLRRKEQRA